MMNEVELEGGGSEAEWTWGYFPASSRLGSGVTSGTLKEKIENQT